MHTTQNMLLNMPKVLSENFREIYDELGPDWPGFYRELDKLLIHLAGTTDNKMLETTTNDIWKTCCDFPYVKGLIVGYGFGLNAERSAQHWRKLEAADFGDDEFVREIVNRFQTLSDTLKEVEQIEGSQELVIKQERRSVRYR